MLLLGAGFVGNAGGIPPSPFTTSGAGLASYYLENGQSNLGAALINMFGGILLAVFAAGLWDRVNESQDGRPAQGWAMVGLLGTGVFVAVLMVTSFIQISMTVMAGIDQPAVEALRGAAIMWNAGILAVGLAAVPLLFGFGMAGLAAPAYARWLAWAGLAGAASGVAGALPDAVAGPAPVLAAVFRLLGQAELLLLFMWVFAVALGFRKARAAPQ